MAWLSNLSWSSKVNTMFSSKISTVASRTRAVFINFSYSGELTWTCSWLGGYSGYFDWKYDVKLAILRQNGLTTLPGRRNMLCFLSSAWPLQASTGSNSLPPWDSCGLGNVTRASIAIAASSKWLKFEFWLNSPNRFSLALGQSASLLAGAHRHTPVSTRRADCSALLSAQVLSHLQERHQRGGEGWGEAQSQQEESQDAFCDHRESEGLGKGEARLHLFWHFRINR